MVCDGTKRKSSASTTVSITAGQGAYFLFRSRFTPAGSISLNKATLGGVGSVLFGIRPLFGTPTRYLERAKTTRPGKPVRAAGDDTTRLPLGRYQITEATTVQPAGRHWILDYVLCNGRPVASARGQATIKLTRSHPNANCTFVNQLIPNPPGPTPPTPPTPPAPPSPPTPPAPPGPPAPPTPVPDLKPADGPIANLSVTKTVSPTIVGPGQPLHYRIVVVNHGPEAAENVVVAELSHGTNPLHIRSSKGKCYGQTPPAARSAGSRPEAAS